ncbi:MAG: hemerythrin domain-containing protein [Anaerolineales bacterium]
MQATQILMDEHRVIERVLSALQVGAERVVRGEEMRPSFFINAAHFIKNFADGCHHHKEEGVFFIAMSESGVPVQGGPIGVMLAEHKQSRLFMRSMKDAAEKWGKGDLSARPIVVHNALGYVALLRQHIHKEDNFLFPMADLIIPLDRQEKVSADFERIEDEETGEGVREKYLALAEVLEKESTEQI